MISAMRTTMQSQLNLLRPLVALAFLAGVWAGRRRLET